MSEPNFREEAEVLTGHLDCRGEEWWEARVRVNQSALRAAYEKGKQSRKEDMCGAGCCQREPGHLGPCEDFLGGLR